MQYETRWKWVVRCTYNNTVEPPKKPGELAIETLHTDDASKDIEVRAAKARGDVDVEVLPYLEGPYRGPIKGNREIFGTWDEWTGN